MHIADLRDLYGYSCWMNDRILDAASRVTAEQFSAPTELTPRNLQDNLVHILDVEWSWRERARGAAREVWIAEIVAADLPDVASMRVRWKEESRIMREYLDGLADDDLAAPFVLESCTVNLGDILLHAINHGILARVEAAVLLTHYGQSPGDLDYLDYADPRP
jgi:uncharacterized damage-inducible protein DinB